MSNEHFGERKPTNVSWIYFFGFFVIVLFGFVGYAFFNGSIYRIINGYDDCGNICGRPNKDSKLNYCGNIDKTMDKFLLMNITQDVENPHLTITHKMCVKRCEDFPDFKTTIDRCYLIKSNKNTNGTDEIDQADATSFTEDLVNSWLGIVMMCIIALVFSYIVLVLFRYCIKYVIWGIYIGIIVLFIGGAIVFLALFFKAKSTDALIISVVLLIFGLVIGLVLFFYRKRIRLVIVLFKEASKALADVPLIIAEPLLTFIAMIFTCFAFLYFAIVIESAGDLTVENDLNGKFVRAEYQKNAVITAAYYVNLVAFMWFTQFILSCQHFIIASTISDWYFARTKSKLDAPISRAFSNLLQFHLGSVCLGSLLITLIRILRIIVEGIRNKLKESGSITVQAVACCCDFIMETLQEILQYLVRNAYIIVAKDGTPLITSGKKAFHLLKTNLVDVIALNQIGDFVLVLGRIFVVLIAGFVGYEMIGKNPAVEFAFIPILIGVIFSFLIIHCFMTVFEMTLDTIFICFCDDCEQNDGVNRPYFMSNKMMEVMRELKHAAGGEFNFGNGNQNNIEAAGMMMLPPNQQYLPINQQYVPPIQKYPPPNQQYPPPSDQYLPLNQQYPPPNDQYLPLNQQFLPPSDQYLPLYQQYPPPNQQYPPNNDQYPPPNQQYPPPNQQYKQ